MIDVVRLTLSVMDITPRLPVSVRGNGIGGNIHHTPFQHSISFS